MSIPKIKLARSLLHDTEGKIASISFVKKDGSVRNMICRLGVVKGLNPNAKECFNGTTNTVAHLDYLLTVYDMKICQYRNVNLSTLLHFKCGEVDVTFD